MSARLFAAVLGMGAAVCLAAPAEARHDNGPVSSQYEGNSHRQQSKAAQRNTKQARRGVQSRRAAQTRRAGSGKQARGRAAQARKQARRSAGTNTVAARAVTSGRSSGGGGASRSCLTPAARGLLGRIEAQFGAVQVISTCRPGAKIRNTGRPSRHASGNAIDFNAGGRKAAIIAWLRANHHSGGTMTYARMSHIHVDIGPRFVSLNHGGRRG
ncbi:D-Ala-D-Ala carboxypeptidase family metallohydrolase [Hyphomicrobium sp.]|uniref:D-Ala-D-Ala carboxypeptidase family metallohydrolase n=1 Tax=Hyphomicrobium sp. TaxID=82 RepID=UPI002CEE5CCA|nr:D-Ala-D-Ala carboxypeptidase family metallohydrolase [Hyphomicrobium sp.]HRN87096.1 D-Ala-D-Ala carboxypeptidase family metallohydrolase [Hyphomicrobium sp.]HRQ26713.1 D-Ala-D-Ala carboxypeptidase family metallohydrolase [Hyphomicrobium sp.]